MVFTIPLTHRFGSKSVSTQAEIKSEIFLTSFLVFIPGKKWQIAWLDESCRNVQFRWLVSKQTNWGSFYAFMIKNCKQYTTLLGRHRKVNEYIPLLFSTWLIILDDRTFVAFTHLEFFAPKISLCFNFQNVINWLLQSTFQDTLKIQDPSSTFRVLWYSVFAFIIMSASKYL